MLKKSLIALAFAAPVLLSQPSFAERDLGAIYTECGLGALIGENASSEETANILAIVTNVTWDLGTTAVISEASSPESCARGSAAMAAFIYQSYDALEKDIASGHGEHLATLKELNQSGEGFESTLRGEFAKQVASADYAEKTHFEKTQDLFNLVTAIN